jgi:hypothetical protein
MIPAQMQTLPIKDEDGAGLNYVVRREESL